MIYLNAFLFAGFICMLGQIILDNTKLTPGHITSIFVVLGALLDTFNIYDILKIPEDLFTPMFLCARIAGWSAHRIEELLSGNRIVRPAFKSVLHPRDYIPIDERTSDFELIQKEYVPQDER